MRLLYIRSLILNEIFNEYTDSNIYEVLSNSY